MNNLEQLDQSLRIGWTLWAGATLVLGLSVGLLEKSFGSALIPVAIMLFAAAIIHLYNGYEWGG